MIGSLWQRIAVAMIGVTAIATSGAGITAWFTTKAMLIRSQDDQLRERGDMLQHIGIPEPLLQHRFHFPFANDNPRDVILRVRSTDNEVLYVSPNGESLTLPSSFPKNNLTPIHIDHDSYRFMSIATTVRQRRSFRDGIRDGIRDGAREGNANNGGNDPRPGPPPDGSERPVLVDIGMNVTSVHHDLRRLAWLLCGLSGGSTAIAAIAALALRRTLLRPVHALTDSIASIDPATLQPRLNPLTAPRELQPMITRLNGFLAQVDGVLSREKQTIGHIAHELRTPIAGLRTTLEFALARGGNTDTADTHQSCLNITVTMQAQIDALLALSRLEAGTEIVAVDAVDVAQELRSAWRHAQATTPDHDIVWHIPDTLPLVSGKNHINTIARNLFANARTYMQGDQPITVTATATGLGWNLTVSNPSICADASHVFEPFWRGDGSRQLTGNSGLGLALCQRLAILLGGNMRAEANGQTFSIHWSLPAYQSAPQTSQTPHV